MAPVCVFSGAMNGSGSDVSSSRSCGLDGHASQATVVGVVTDEDALILFTTGRRFRVLVAECDDGAASMSAILSTLARRLVLMMFRAFAGASNAFLSRLNFDISATLVRLDGNVRAWSR